MGVVSKIILPLLFLFIELRTAKQNFIFANFFFDEKFKDFGEEPRSGCMKWTGFDFWKQNISSGHSSFRYYNIGTIGKTSWKFKGNHYVDVSGNGNTVDYFLYWFKIKV